MIWIVILGLFVAFGVLSYYLDSKTAADWESGMAAAGICAFVTLLVLVIAVPSCTIRVFNIRANYARIDKDVPIIEKQYEQVVAIIRLYASKYPIEEKLLTGLDPKILLKLPEIKSDVFLTEQIALAVEYQTKIYALQLEKNRLWAKAQVYSHRWFIPSLVAPNLDQ